jgi:hypothetical protein
MEILWWQRILQATDFDSEYDLTLLRDNRQTLRLFTKKGPSFYTKLRHIDIANHRLHQEISKGTIKLAWARTNDMPADGLTKALPRQKHEAFIKLIGRVDIEERIQRHNN